MGARFFLSLTVTLVVVLLILGFMLSPLYPSAAFQLYTQLFQQSTELRPWHRGGKLSDVKIYAGAECDRVCVAGEPPRICYFEFIAESYASMGSACGDCRWGNQSHCFHEQCATADGMERSIMTFNRKLPGPSVLVCKNDLVVVDLNNHMEGSSSSIHWHGIHQTDTPWMDGVPMVTQCPVPQGTTFRYLFNASEQGTQFYHSHSGHHKANGHYGVFVVRDPNDISRDLYDYDLSQHSIIISDWTLEPAETFVPGLQSKTIRMESILINGRGRHFDEEEQELQLSPLTVFRVKSGKRYRFRMVSAGSQFCPFQLQIEKHRLQLISTDGGTVRPVMIDSLVSTSGERYDFVLAANQKPGNYWVRVRAIGFCNIERREEFAVLSYADDSVTDEELAFPTSIPPSWDYPYPDGIILNHPNTTCYIPDNNYLCAADLESYEVQRDDDLMDRDPDKKFVISFNTFTADTNMLFSSAGYVRYMTVVLTLNNIGVTNNISMVMPRFPLLTQPEMIPNEQFFCNETYKPATCEPEHACFCTHRLKVALNDIVEMSLIDVADVVRDLYHPFHLHGHRFVVTGMGQLPNTRSRSEKIQFTQKQQRRRGGMPSDHNPPYKDTVSVPSRGYTKIRFRADNPGFWLIHCHFEWHLGIGMSFVLQVGEIEQMKKPPKNFPRCGDYKPNVRRSLRQL